MSHPARAGGEAVNLWDPSHVSLSVDLLTAFLLGLVHELGAGEWTFTVEQLNELRYGHRGAS